MGSFYYNRFFDSLDNLNERIDILIEELRLDKNEFFYLIFIFRIYVHMF